MTLDLLTRELVCAFLSWLENERKCSVSTRNQRLAALHSFCRFMQTEDVMRLNQYQLVISIPKKRGKSGSVNYMSPEGVKLILEQPDAKKMSGRRNMVLLSLMYDSGARVQEMADISVGDFRAEPPATIKITGPLPGMYGASKSLISRIASRLKGFFAGWETITGKKYLTCAKSHKRFVWNDSVSVSLSAVSGAPLDGTVRRWMLSGRGASDTAT